MKRSLSWSRYSKHGRKCWEWKEKNKRQNRRSKSGLWGQQGWWACADCLLRWYHISAVWEHWDSLKKSSLDYQLKNFPDYLCQMTDPTPRLRTLHAINAVTHFSWVEGIISCGYLFQTSKGSGGSEKHPAVQMLVWTAWACTTGPAVLPEQRVLWDSSLFLDLHGPELPQELGFLCWHWRNCFHPDPGSTKSVWKTRARRQFWFTSQLKRSSWFLSLPEPAVPGMRVCVSARVCVCWAIKSA